MKKNLISTIATIISVLLIIAGTVGLILLQKPLREESQDIRKDASVNNGQVSISSSPASGSKIELNQDSVINLQANTQGVQTDGVQLVFNLITNTLSEVPTISVPSSLGLQNIYSQIEQTSDGYLVSVIAVPQQIGATFSSSSPTTIAQLKVKPTTAGNIEISFDREKSKSIIHATNPPQDTLTHISTLNFTVDHNTNASPSPSPSVSPSPNPTPGTGGITVQGCNDACGSNAECETNNRCYNGQCRLVTNVSSTTCTEKPDQGLSFGCNEYCADSRECADQYTCLENKCRRSDNPDDTYCKIPSTTLQSNIASSCNTSCGTNKDCAANLRCYYGACRLATNASSTTCSAASTKTVSKLYTKPDTTTPKGGGLDDEDQDATDSTIPAAIIYKPSPAPSSSADTDQLLKEETALDAIISSLQKAGIPVNLLPLIALGVGGLLLLLVIVPKIFGHKTKPGSSLNKPGQTPSTNRPEQDLQTRINELKKQPPAPATMTTPVTMTPPTTMATPVSQPIPPTVPIMTGNRPTPTPTHSPMIERIKEKGINPPKI